MAYNEQGNQFEDIIDGSISGDVEKGVITEIQLQDALAESNRTGVPIGSTLYEMGYITLNDLKTALSDQTGYELVSTDMLANQKDYVNTLTSMP